MIQIVIKIIVFSNKINVHSACTPKKKMHQVSQHPFLVNLENQGKHDTRRLQRTRSYESIFETDLLFSSRKRFLDNIFWWKFVNLMWNFKFVERYKTSPSAPNLREFFSDRDAFDQQQAKVIKKKKTIIIQIAENLFNWLLFWHLAPNLNLDFLFW